MNLRLLARKLGDPIVARRGPLEPPSLARCSPDMNAEPSMIVIGASVGGVEALRALVATLPADLRAAVFIVLHVGSHKSELPWLLDRLGGLPARHAEDGDAIEGGQIYIAPPDQHMVIQRGRISLTRGPRENWARPAIDPLFRSAADVYGQQVIAIILTGALNDGTAGLYQVAQAGGTTIVQDPADAINPSMPRSALAHVAVDHCLPLAGMGQLLIELVETKSTEAAHGVGEAPAQRPQEQDKEEEMAAEFTQNTPVAVTCPDCGGALRRRQLGSLTQFACHIGHIYTAEVMMAAQFVTLERFIESAMRSLGERAELCRQMDEKTGEHGRSTWEAAKCEAHQQADSLQEMLTREWIHPDGIGVIENANP